MREIKFRVWYKKYKSFLKEKDFTINLLQLCKLNKDFIIQQFTGLKSKSAQDVYEGDIIKVKSYGDWLDNEQFDVILRVGWSEIECGWRGFAYLESPKWRTSGSKITECEVIGNIFENADLLKNNLTNSKH